MTPRIEITVLRDEAGKAKAIEVKTTEKQISISRSDLVDKYGEPAGTAIWFSVLRTIAILETFAEYFNDGDIPMALQYLGRFMREVRRRLLMLHDVQTKNGESAASVGLQVVRELVSFIAPLLRSASTMKKPSPNPQHEYSLPSSQF